MKRLFSIIILLAVLSSFHMVYAADAAGSAEDSQVPAAKGDAGLDENTVYTLVKLQEIAAAESRQALADDINIKMKEMTVRTIHSDSDMNDSILSVTKPMAAKLELEAAQKIKLDNLKQLKTDIYKVVVGIALYHKEMELQEQKLSMAKEKLAIANAKFMNATIIQDDLDSVQYNVDSSQVKLASVKEKLNSQYLELKRLLNQPLNTSPVHISIDLKQAAFAEADLDFSLAGLYKTETALVKASGKLSIAQTAMEIAKKVYKKGDATYDSCVSDLEEASLDLAQARTVIEVKVKNKYNEMVNKRDDIELAAQYAGLIQKKLSSVQIRYDKGMISRESRLEAEEAFMESEFAKLTAIVEYNIAVEEFNSILGRQ